MRAKRAGAFFLAMLSASFLVPLSGANQSFTTNGHTISFDDKGGNEWWVEVVVQGASAAQVTGVDAMDTDGPWTHLAHESWGSWAASFHVEPGHLVKYRALFGDGTLIESCWITHPAGVEQCGSTPPPPGNFTATFTSVSGNEWWIQTHATATGGTIATVDASLNGGAWQPLKLQSWGDWAASYHAPSGTIVRLRATSTTGATSLGGCYHWTDAATADCPGTSGGGTFAASFSPRPGNEWWVEAYVQANAPVVGVDARVNGTSWVALTHESWGSWAASVHAPDGALVDFRARATDGQTAMSVPYVWPDAQPIVQPTNVWPREGSFVKAQSHSGEGVPGYFTQTETNLTMSYHHGDWTQTFESWTFTHHDYDPANDTFTRDSGAGPGDPFRGPTWNVKIGDETPMGTIVGSEDRNTTRNGTAATSRAWHASFRPVWPQDIEAYWHAGTGLMLEYSDSRSHSYNDYSLLDTDAPLAKTDPPFSPPARAAWPFAGSYVNAVQNASFSNSYVNGWNASSAAFSFQNGYWQGACAWRSHDNISSDASGTFRFAGGPAVLWTNVTVGSQVPARPLANACLDSWIPGLTVRGQFALGTVRNGAPFTAETWWANQTDPQDSPTTVWWDVGTGLVLRYQQASWASIVSRVSDTDAPLTKA